MKLPAKSGCESYSIVAENDPRIVSVYTSSKTQKKTVRCHSGLCNVNRGHQRLYANLGNSKNLCSHLLLYRSYMSIDDDGDEEIEASDPVFQELPKEAVKYSY